MEKPEQKQGYSLLAKGLHWGFVLLFAYGIFKQVDDLNQLADSALFRFEMGFALVFLLVVLLRYLYMSRTQETALPADTPRWQKIAARTVHLGLYASLAGIALSGLLIGGLYWLGLRDGILIEAVVELHGALVSLSYWLIGLHIAGALFHRLRRDGVWSAMVPVWKEKAER